MTTTPDSIRQILEDWGMRFQDPSIKKTRGKNPKWVIRPVVPVLINGEVIRKQKLFPLGRVREMTIKEAQREKQRLMSEINGGEALITAQIKMADLIKEFTEARLPILAVTTQRKYQSNLINHVYDLKEMQLFEVTPAFVQGWLIKRKLGGWAKLDVKNLLSAMFEQARKWKMWDKDNPIEGVDLPRMSAKREKRIPTEDQIRRLRDALDCCGAVAGGVSGPDVRQMLDVVISSGWRISEVLGLRPDAILGDVIEVKRRWSRGDLAEVPKSEAGKRRNYIGAMAGELLARAKCDFVFCGDDSLPPDDRDIQQHILRPCAVAVGCYWEGFGFHSFRRLNNSWRQEAGATPSEVMRALGHTKADMTLHYTVVDQEREKAVVDKILGRVQ